MFVLDSHCDTPLQLLCGSDLSLENAQGHVDFPRMRRGGVDASFFALYIPPEIPVGNEAFAHALKLLSLTQKAVEDSPDLAAFATDSASARSNKSKGLLSVFLGLENASPIGESLDCLQWFYDQGVRYVTLCHNADNQICDSAAGKRTYGGLSPFGREVVRKMNKIGMIIDCAHVSDETFFDVIKLSSKSVVTTHSSCRALCNHRRNMSDTMLRALADNGGVIQINFYPFFIDDGYAADPEHSALPSYKRVVDHIDHAIKVAGIDHVGIGSDFDGIEVCPQGLEDISRMGLIFDEMRVRGYSEGDIEKVAGENFLRVLDAQ